MTQTSDTDTTETGTTYTGTPVTGVGESARRPDATLKVTGEFAYASDHDTVVADLADSRQQVEALAVLVRQIAQITPREGQCARTWRALQARARQALEAVQR